MRSEYFQTEAIRLQNKGYLFHVPITADGVIIGLQSTCSATPLKTPTDSPPFEHEFAEVLYQARWYPTMPDFSKLTPQAYMPPWPGPENPEFGQFQLHNPAGIPNVSAGVGGPGFIFSIIGKVTMGASLNKDIVYPPGSLRIRVRAGDAVVWHLDHAGVPVDAEAQGLLWLWDDDDGPMPEAHDLGARLQRVRLRNRPTRVTFSTA